MFFRDSSFFLRLIRILFLSVAICLFDLQCNGQQSVRLGATDFYFNLSFTGNVSASHLTRNGVHTHFNYSVIDQGGYTKSSNFSSTWLPNKIKNSFGSNIKFEFGNYRAFGAVSIGGFDRGTVFTAGAGINMYFSAFRNSNVIRSQCWVIKPSINLAFSQTFPFNSYGNDLYLLGQVDNQNKTIDALGYQFNPSYTIAATKNQPAQTVQAQTLNLFFMENNVLLYPKISIGKNNYERLFYLGFEIGYFIPIAKKRAIQLYQDDGYSEKTIWLNDNSGIMDYNGKSLNSLPSFINGLTFGVTVGLNISKQIIDTSVLQKRSFRSQCPCSFNKKKKVKLLKLKKRKSNPKEKIKSDESNTKGF